MLAQNEKKVGVVICWLLGGWERTQCCFVLLSYCDDSPLLAFAYYYCCRSRQKNYELFIISYMLV
jgi:hypothetical protein